MLVGAYGNDYFVSNYYQFTLTGSAQFYALPDGTPSYVDATGAIAAKFYKLIDVDLQYSASPSGWITLKRFEEIERNKYMMPNTYTTVQGYTNLRYRPSGNSIMFNMVPQAGQLARIRYIPAPTNLQYTLPGYAVQGSAVIGSMTDTTGIQAGMNIWSYNQNIVPSNTTILSVSTTTMTMSATSLATQNANIFSMWSDATTFDGIAGFEEYLILDSAIKGQIKQEGPTADLVTERDRMRLEIEAMAEGRDAGQAHHVSDVLGINGMFGDGNWGSGDDW